MGQPVLVEPRPGANTIIGSEAMVKSAPDGYTFLLISTTHVLNGLLIPNLPYDTARDFAPVATIASSELILVGSPKVAASNVRELVTLGKARQLSYATSSAGGPTHLAAELFSSMTGVKLTHIPYKGSGPAVNDLLGGHVDIGWTSPLAVIQHINAGKLKAIAISGDNRVPSLPNVPTFTESGLPGFEMRFWYGLLAPAATPRDILNRVSAEVARILTTADMKEKLAAQGADPFISNPDQFGAVMRADNARYGKVIREAGIKVAQ
jgi:tripartite-type tricarboxylate transporter receptor subunit TctC